MTEQANRIDWLERQLAQVNRFIQRDSMRLQESPGRFSVQLALDSWLSHRDELHHELRQAKVDLQLDDFQLRLLCFGGAVFNKHATVIIATRRRAIANALIAQGFRLVNDLPNPVRLEHTPRGMLIARLS